ncbi:tetracycline repressor protein [Escherichia coli]|nr:tetracycline repressor protein [Escherichia coli]
MPCPSVQASRPRSASLAAFWRSCCGVRSWAVARVRAPASCAWRSFLIGNARSFRQALLAYRDGARIHAGTRPGAPQMETADAQLRFLCEAGFSAGDAVNALMTISYFTVGAVLEEQAGDSDAGERGGTVEQAPLSPLLRAAIDAFDEAGPDAAFEQGLAVIVDGLAKRRLVVRNVEGPRKGDD